MLYDFYQEVPLRIHVTVQLINTTKWSVLTLYAIDTNHDNVNSSKSLNETYAIALVGHLQALTNFNRCVVVLHTELPNYTAV